MTKTNSVMVLRAGMARTAGPAHVSPDTILLGRLLLIATSVASNALHHRTAAAAAATATATAALGSSLSSVRAGRTA